MVINGQWTSIGCRRISMAYPLISIENHESLYMRNRYCGYLKITSGSIDNLVRVALFADSVVFVNIIFVDSRCVSVQPPTSPERRTCWSTVVSVLHSSKQQPAIVHLPFSKLESSKVFSRGCRSSLIAVPGSSTL